MVRAWAVPTMLSRARVARLLPGWALRLEVDMANAPAEPAASRIPKFRNNLYPRSVRLLFLRCKTSSIFFSF